MEKQIDQAKRRKYVTLLQLITKDIMVAVLPNLIRFFWFKQVPALV